MKEIILIPVISLLLAACGASDTVLLSGDQRAPSEAVPFPVPLFGSVTQSTNVNSGYTTDRAEVELDDRGVVVRIARDERAFEEPEREGWSWFALDEEPSRDLVFHSDEAVLDTGAVAVTAAGNIFGTGRSVRAWNNVLIRTDGLSYATYAINWNDADSTDWYAAGHWLHFSGDLLVGRVENVEVGAFIDGPEFDEPQPDLPVTGTATFKGKAAGMYGANYGPTNSNSSMFGSFLGDAELTANFDGGTIAGCVGCSDGIYLSGTRITRADAETVPHESTLSGWTITLELTVFDRPGGTFSGRTDVDHSSSPVSATNGSWGGRFSNVSDTSGNPRMVAGTLGAAARRMDGTHSVFVGTFTAPVETSTGIIAGP